MILADPLEHLEHRLTRLKEVADSWLDDVCPVCGYQQSWRAQEEIEARASALVLEGSAGWAVPSWSASRHDMLGGCKDAHPCFFDFAEPLDGAWMERREKL